MTKPEGLAELEALDDEALRREARSRGLPVGRTLSRAQLLDLLRGEDEEGAEETAAAAPGPAPAQLSTVTLAKLYAQQGLEREATVVARSVLASHPGEARARRLLERLASAQRAARPAPATAAETRHRFPPFHRALAQPGAPAPAPLPERYGAPAFELLAQSPTTLYACWDVEPERERRARALAGEAARRVLRLFSAWRGPLEIERRTRDVTLDEAQRDAFVGPCQPGAVHRTAVGWLGRGGQFVPVCHSGATQTPVDKPHPPKRPVWRELAATRAATPSARAAVRLIERLKRPRLSMALPWEGRGAGGGQVRWPQPAPPSASRPGEEPRGGDAASWARSR